MSCSEPLLLSLYHQDPELSAKHRQVPPLAQQSPRAGLFMGSSRHGAVSSGSSSVQLGMPSPGPEQEKGGGWTFSSRPDRDC